MSDIPRSPVVDAALEAEGGYGPLTRVIAELDLSDPQRAVGRDLQARHAVETLRIYIVNIGATHNDQQVMRLLLALAGIERALWLESGGRLGSEHAHLSTVLDRYLAE